MQTATQLVPMSRVASGPARAGAERAEFRFESDAALERACALALGQSWIASCSVDRARRTLQVTLCSGAAGVGAPAILH